MTLLSSPILTVNLPSPFSRGYGHLALETFPTSTINQGPPTLSPTQTVTASRFALLKVYVTRYIRLMNVPSIAFCPLTIATSRR
ncbi:hypothetical protein [Deinococcus hopiensis]|uniref:hypothetical protein n=1 Tax=Deinococcus hopiensis TaxID=309885 RepID=UPI00111C3A70|nr:hypothetical protein [Deinococcus hopiensis]